MAWSNSSGRTAPCAWSLPEAATDCPALSRCSDAIPLKIVRKKTMMLPLSELAAVLDDLPLRSGRALASPRRFTLAGADRTPGFFRYLLKERRNDFVTSLRVSRFGDKLPPLVDHPFFRVKPLISLLELLHFVPKWFAWEL